MKEILAALAACQAACEAPKKTSVNPHFKSKFADLASVMAVLHEPLAANGLAIVQSPSLVDGKTVTVQTTLFHKSGESLDCGTLSMPTERPGPQAVGSAITYARRYALMAVFGLAGEDDDAESAEQRKPAKTGRTLDDVAEVASARPFAESQPRGTSGPGKTTTETSTRAVSGPDDVAALLVDLPRCETRATLVSWAKALLDAKAAKAAKESAWTAWAAQCGDRELVPAELAKEARAK
jgi:hypothetical protein